MAVSLSQIRVEAVLDAAGYVAGGNAKVATDAKMVQSGQQLVGTLDATDRKLSSTGTSAERLARSLDPAYASTQKLETGMRTLQRAVDGGSITTDRHAQLVTLLRQRYGEATPAVNDNAAAHAGLSTQAQSAMHSIRSMAESLALGISPTQALTQQLNHLTYAASGPGGLRGAFSDVIGTFGRFINPTTAVVAATAAVAAGFGFLITRAVQAQSEIRGFNVLLAGMGAGSLATGAGLDAASRRLRDVGLTPAEASVQQTAVIRAGLNPAAAERVVRTGANLTPVLGDSATQALTTALKGGIEDTIKFGQAIGVFDANQVTAFRNMARGGETIKALDQAFGLIENRANGLHRDALGPVAQKMEDLRISTAKLIDTMAKSAVIEKAVDILDKFVTGLDGVANLKPPAWMLALIPGGGLAAEYMARQNGGASGVVASAAIPPASGTMNVDQALALIERYESGGRNVQNFRFDGGHTAQGNFQITNSTWRGIAGAAGIDLNQFPNAMSAPYNVQRQAASTLYQQQGFSPWAPYNPQLASAIASGGSGASLTNPLTAAETSKAAVDKLTQARKDQLEIEKGIGLEQELARARQEALQQNDDKKITGTAALNNILLAEAAARQKVQIEQQKQTEASTLEARGTLKVAEAYGVSTAAGLRMQAVLQATIETRLKFGNESAASPQGEAEIARRSAELAAEQSAKATLAVQQSINARTDQIALSQLEVQLQGKTSEEIAAQVASLQEKQRLLNEGLSLTGAIAQKDLASVDALGKQNIARGEAVRAQGRIDDTVRSLGDTISSTLVTRMEDVFSGNRVKSWGETLRSVLNSVLAMLASNLLIKPLIGSVLSSVGLTNAASSFGTFGDFFGGSSSGNSSSGLNGIGSGLSGASKIGGLFDSGGGLGFGTTASGIGGLLTEGPATVFGTGIGEAGAAFGVGDALGGLGIGSVLGIGGALLGGVGLLGGLFGGGGGLFGGLFGSSKKPDKTSSGTIDLATGRMKASVTGPNPQNASTVKSIDSQLSQFLKTANQIGSISGQLLVQAGSRDGIRLSYNSPGTEWHQKAGDAESAVQIAEQSILRNLSVTSASLRTILDKLDDPSRLQEVATFAAAYDNLKKASDSAFSSLATDTAKIGPYETALNSLNTTFDGLTTQANEFSLSLDPLTKGLAEAKRRLIADFGTDVQNMLDAIHDPVKGQIAAEKIAGKARVDDAKAIGADLVQVNQLNADKLSEIWKNSTASLQDLETSLKTGSLSGKSAASQALALNDNYKRELTLVQGGNVSEAGNLASAGNSLISAYQSAYGNAPITARLRKQLIGDLGSALANGRSFAGGTDYTPPGLIRVGERGPELIYQPGGLAVLPNGRMPGGSDLAPKIDRMIALLEGNNAINREHAVITDRGLKRVVGTLDKPVLTAPKRTAA